MTPLLFLLLLTLGQAGYASESSVATGFRGDGTGRYEHVVPPLTPELGVVWTIPTAAWSNASLVPWDDLLCTTAEPTTTLCVRASSGETVWSATSDYADTLDRDARTSFLASRQQLTTLQEAFRTARAEYSQTRRALRASPHDTALVAKLGTLSKTMETLSLQLDEAVQYDTPPTKEIIGYATATPLVHGDALYALFGHGVVSRFDRTGKRLWSTWMGPPPAEMRGYHLGTAASPVLVGDTLIVAHGSLRGLDPATGSTRWQGMDYADFGTPSPGEVGGIGFVAIPTGQIIRASDGEVLASDLGDQWYAGPLVDGDRVFFAGDYGTTQIRQAGGWTAAAWRLIPEGDGLRAEPLWKTQVPGTAALYNQPVRVGDTLVAVDVDGVVWGLDVHTGDQSWRHVSTHMLGAVYAGAVAADGHVYIVGEEGGMIVLDVRDGVAERYHARVGKTRSVPSFRDHSMYLRSLDHIQRIDRPHE